MARGRSWLLWCIGFVAVASSHLWAQDPTTRMLAEFEKLRVVYVPFEDLNVVLGDGVDRILVDRSEVLALLEFESKTESVPPREFVWQQADYKFQLGQRVAHVSARMVGRAFNDRGTVVPLPWRGVSIRLIQLNGQAPAVFWSHDRSERRLNLLVHEAGEVVLDVELTLPLSVDAARQTVRGMFSEVPVSTWAVVSPGNVDLVAGGAVIERTYHPESDRTEMAVVPASGKFEMVFTVNNRQRGGELVWDDAVVIRAGLGETEDTYAVRLLPRVIQGTMPRAEWEVGDKLEILDVTGANIREWGVLAADAGQKLWVEFQNPVTAEAEIGVVALGKRETNQDTGSWNLPKWRGVAADQSSQIVGITTPPKWTIRSITAPKLFAVDVGDVDAILSGSTEHGSSSQRADLAWFAPFGNADLQLELARKPDRLESLCGVLFDISEREISCLADMVLVGTGADRFEVEIDLPPGFQLLEAHGADGPLPVRVMGADRQQTRIAVTLDRALRDGQRAKIMLRASAVLADWYSPWDRQELELVTPTIVGSQQTQGVLAIVVSGELNVTAVEAGELTPLTRQDLVGLGFDTLAPELAYEFDQAKAAVQIELVRRIPRLSAQSVTFYRLEPSRRVVHAELLIDVQQASSQRFALKLPQDAADVIQVTTGDGRPVAEMTRRDLTDAVVWDVQLVDRAIGPLRLSVDYETGVPDAESFSLELAPVLLGGATLQSQLVVVEGSPQLDVSIQRTGDQEALEGMPAVSYQPGKFLVGLFSVGSDESVLVTAARRQVSPAPPIVVSECMLRSELSANGVCQTWGQYQLKTTHPDLIIRLPAGATLWSLSLDQVPQRVQRIGNDVLLMFPRGSTNQMTILELSYEMPMGSIRWASSIELPLPQLLITNQQSQPVEEVPALAMSWQVVAPAGYRVSARDDSWQNRRRDEPETWAERNGRWLASCFAQIQLVRESAYPGSEVGLKGGIEIPRKDLADMPMVDVDGVVSFSDASDAVRLMTDGSDVGGAEGFSFHTPRNLEPLRSTRESGTWSSLGFRAIKIQIDEDRRAALFEAIGNRAVLEVHVANERAHWMLAQVVCFVAFAVGLLLCCHSLAVRLVWIMILLVMAIVGLWIANWIPGADVVAELLVWVALALVAMYIAIAIVRTLMKDIAWWRVKRRTMKAAVSLIWLAGLSGLAQAQNGSDVSANDHAPHLPPRVVDDRAVVVPFDLSAWPNTDSQRWLFPKAWYERLMADREAPPPENLMANRQFAWSQGDFVASTDGTTLMVEGVLNVLLPGDNAVELPIEVAGGSLVKATLDGQPATLITDVASHHPEVVQGNTTVSELPLRLRVAGAGLHQAQLSIAFPLVKTSGGFRASGRLPTSLATDMTFHAGPEPLVVRFRSGPIETEDTLEPHQKTSFSVAADGAFVLEWREAIAPSRVAGSANWHSDTLIEVLTNELRGRADLTIQFGESLDRWQLRVPSGVRLESITGENIQRWTHRDEDSALVDVHLLAESTATKATVTYALAFDPLTITPVPIDVPLCAVEGRGSVTGRVRMTRSDQVSVDVIATDGVRRIDWQADGVQPLSANFRQPLFVVPFQSFDFARSGARIQLQAQLVRQTMAVNHEVFLRLGLSQCEVFAMVRLQPTSGSIREFDLAVPTALAVRESDWRVVDDSQRHGVEFTVTHHIQGEYAIWRFRLAQEAAQTVFVIAQFAIKSRGTESLDWLAWKVLGAESERFEYAADHDSALLLEMTTSGRALKILGGQLGDWFKQKWGLSNPLAARADSSEHALSFWWRRLSPRVKFESITDVSWTRRSIEETILLDWTIEQSGVDAVAFALPERWSEAQVQGPLISRVEKTRRDDGWVEFKVNLQDRVLRSYRLAVQLDTGLTAEWSATLPMNLTGETTQRFVTVQNMGRDELVFQPTAGVEEVVRQRPLFKTLQDKLRAPFLATAYFTNSNDRDAGLTIRAVPSELVQTVAASIPLSETDVVLDAGGGYIAKQVLRVNNRTEPVLEVLLPNRARLVGLRVDGAVATPLAAPAQSQLIRVPLVKTSELELDYPVELIYSGRLASRQSEWAIPLAHTQNIETQVSHVRLHVDKSLKPLWFDGTMTRVDSGDTLVDEYLDYQSRQLETISGKLKSESGRSNYGYDNTLQRMEQLAGEINEQSQLGQNMRLRSKSDELQRNLSELNRQTEELANDEAAAGNRIRRNINELVSEQTVENEKKRGAQVEGRMQVGGEETVSEDLKELSGRLIERQQAFQVPQEQSAGQTFYDPGQAQVQYPTRPGSGLGGMGGMDGDDRPADGRFGDGQLAHAAPAPRVSSGVELEFKPRGMTYYFRVPRGNPQLSMRVMNVETQTRVFSTMQIAAMMAVILVLGVLALRARSRPPHRNQLQ